MSSFMQGLLPGIPDDITLTRITTKLPGTAFRVLSSVSRKWKQAIQDREVYTQRIRSQSTETLIVIKHLDPEHPHGDRNWISLCSMREKAFYKLPPVPQFGNGISRYAQFISMDGKLYVLGAGSQHELDFQGNMQASMPAYVLDLAGNSSWKMCRGVPEPKRGYEFKIGYGYRMSFGDRNILKGGCENWYRSFWQERDISVPAEWRAVVGLWRSSSIYPGAPWLVVQGKIYWMYTGERGKSHVIEAYDASTESIIHQHSISWEELTPEITAALPPSPSPLDLHPCYILPANNELFLLATWTKYYQHDPNNNNILCLNPLCTACGSGFCLLQSKGFGTSSKDIVWELTGSHISWHFNKHPESFLARFDVPIAICPIQL